MIMDVEATDSSEGSADGGFDSDENTQTNSKGSGLKRVKYDDINAGSAKKIKKYTQKPPTVEELNNLRETQNLYNNNLFRLQIEELIKEIKIKTKHRKALQQFLNEFTNLVNNLPEIADVSLNKISKMKKASFLKDLLQEPRFKTDQDFTLNFSKPQQIVQFGLDKFDALAGPLLISDVALIIPKTFLHPKDFTNNRYFHKRHLYLKYICHFVSKANICDGITWINHDNNPLLPILQANCGKVTVRIHSTPPEDYFKTSRFLPDTNNIKANVFEGSLLGDEILSKNLPTPYYNSALAYDAYLLLNSSYVSGILGELGNVKEGLKLLQVWQRQRKLCLGEEFLTFFAVYLLRKNRINKHMSSYQIVRNFWNFFVGEDLSSTSLTINDEVSHDVLSKFKENFDLVFVDTSGFYNILSSMDLQVYKKLRSECEIALELLDDEGLDSFQSLFISKSPNHLQFDLLLSLDTSNCEFEGIYQKSSDEDKVKFAGFKRLLITREVRKMLERGLNKRALLIVPNLDLESEKIVFGINLDQSHAFNFIEKGPALNDSKEKEFRDFWGSLSTDRRFKDGTVCVAVYFETDTIKGKREIVKKIIDHVMRVKLNSNYYLLYDELEEFIVNQKVKASFNMGTNEECCLYVIKAFDDLGKKLRSLELPLGIAGIFSTSPTCSFTEVFPQIPTNYRAGKTITAIAGNCIVFNESAKKISSVPKYVKPVECVLQMEQSSKWPKTLEGIRLMKTAFYLEIAKLLEEKDKIVSSVKSDFIDVFYSGVVFRYHLYVPKEIGLLKREITSNGAIDYKDTPESRKLEIELKILPKVSGALRGLQSQFPSYGPTTALIKRWVRAHLIDNHLFPDLALDLLNASLFVNKSQFLASTVPQVAFLRFLKFFSELQTDLQAVVVNFNNELISETLANLDSKLLQNRSSYPNLFVATPYDNCESLFTKSAPSKQVLRRVKHLSLETLVYIQEKVAQSGLEDSKKLFTSNLEGYHAIIHLRPLLNPLRHEQISGSDGGLINYEEFDAKVSTKVPITDFNPIQLYLKELRENYSELATFFHDSYGGNFIAVLWTPEALRIEDFKVAKVHGRKLNSNKKLVLNIDALISDFALYGEGIVKNIEKLFKIE